ncbi:MAG: radical SAM protein [Candidatus Brocadiia bacterium]
MKSLLVIDDQLAVPSESESFCRAYPIDGCEFRFAATGDQADQILHNSADICLVLLDVDFGPKGPTHGLDILQHLVARGCEIPIVMLTAVQDRSILDTAKDFGAMTHVIKWGGNTQFYEDLTRAVRDFALPEGRRTCASPVTHSGGPSDNELPAPYCPMSNGKYKADFANGLLGWVFSAESIRRAAASGRMLTLDIDSCPTERCNLRCQYCYRNSDDRDVLPQSQSLEYRELVALVASAASLGVESIKVVGAGEPFIDTTRNILLLCEVMRRHGIQPVVFTNGTVFASEGLANTYFGMSCRALAERLNDLGVSIVLKANSRVESIQDDLVLRPGYSKQRDRAMKLLMDLAFNGCNPTRLGCDLVVLRQVREQVFDDYVYYKERNIYPVINTYIPCGLTSKQDNIQRFDVSDEDKIDLFTRILAYNVSRGIRADIVSSYAGGQACTQLGYGMYVTIQGEVFPCPAHHYRIGSIRRQLLRDLWQSNIVGQQWRRCLDNGCPPRISAGSLPSGFFEAVRERLNKHVV